MVDHVSENSPHISLSSFAVFEMLADKYEALAVQVAIPTIETSSGHHRPVIGTRRTENLVRYSFDLTYKRKLAVGTRVLEMLVAGDDVVSVGTPLLVSHENRMKRLDRADADNPMDPTPTNVAGYYGLRLVVSTADTTEPEAQLLGLTRQSEPGSEIIPTTALMAETLLRVSADAMRMKGKYFLSFPRGTE